MSVAWHIIRKDFGRLRWVLVLWVVLLIAGLGLPVIQANLSYEEYFPFWIAAVVLLMGFLPLLAFGLVMGLLHDDPVAEVDAFWITRPISGGQLLVAKLFGLLLFAVIPVLVTVPFWLSYDYRWSQIGWAALLTMRNHFFLIALALPVAAISASGSKFVMNVIVGVAGCLLLVLLLSIGDADNPAIKVPSGLFHSKAWLFAGLWLTVGLVVTLNQFFRRRTRQSMMVLVGAVLLSLPVLKWWSWDFVAPLAPLSSAVGGAPVFSALIDGAIRPTAVLAEVPLHDNARTASGGQTLRIQSVLMDYTGQLQVAFSEGVPELSHQLGDILPDKRKPTVVPEYYFITNASDGRMLPVTPSMQGNGLTAATMRFRHFNLQLRPAAANWQGGAPSDLAAWLQGARLIKVVPLDPSQP